MLCICSGLKKAKVILCLRRYAWAKEYGALTIDTLRRAAPLSLEATQDVCLALGMHVSLRCPCCWIVAFDSWLSRHTLGQAGESVWAPLAYFLSLLPRVVASLIHVICREFPGLQAGNDCVLPTRVTSCMRPLDHNAKEIAHHVHCFTKMQLFPTEF